MNRIPHNMRDSLVNRSEYSTGRYIVFIVAAVSITQGM